MGKLYSEPVVYEAKLKKVMSRLGVERYDYDWSRRECWVEFFYKGNAYRFVHSLDNAQKHGSSVQYGSDLFAQVVLSLEDLARMVERGIYDLSVWVAGMKALPQPQEIPSCFQTLQFAKIPDRLEEVKERYKKLAKVFHPDAGGSQEEFGALRKAYEQATEYLEKER